MALLLFLAAFSFAAVFSPAAFASGTGPPGAPLPHRLAAADDNGATGKVIVLVIDALSIENFVAREWTNLRRLSAGGVIGLMNTRTASTPSSTISAAAHLTIGSGTRAPAGTNSGHAFAVDERWNGVPASQLYTAATGRPPPDKGVVVLGVPQMTAAGQPEGARPGALGRALETNDKSVAVIGNADVPDPNVPLRFPASSGPSLTPRRHGPLIAMNESGHIPLGAVGTDTLLRDADWPFQWRTDYDGVWNLFTQMFAAADVVIVELGDFARLNALSEWIADDHKRRLERATVGRIDEWIDRLAQWPPAAHATFVVVSPSPPTAALRSGHLLSPVVWTRIPPASTVAKTPPPGGAGPSRGPALATSPTTRRAGIIANTDIAPALLAALATGDVGPVRPAPPQQLRRDLPPAVVIPDDPWQTVALLYARATATHGLRTPVVRAFISSAIALFIAWVAWMLAMHVSGRNAAPPRIVRVWRGLMLLLMAAPLAMLTLSLLPPSMSLGESASNGRSLLSLGLLTGGFAAIAHILGRRSPNAVLPTNPGANGDNPDGNGSDVSSPDRAFSDRSFSDRASDSAFIGLALVTALAIVLDAWAGSPLMKSSVLGYDPIVGARYYGIGNEFMGVLIGTVLVGAPGLHDVRPHRPVALWVVPAAFALVTVTLAAPALGANVGGTIAAVVGFSVTTVLLFGGRLTWKTFVLIAGAVVIALAAAALFDLLGGRGAPSHLGQTVRLVQDGGLQPFVDIVKRKLAMNAKLLQWTIWAQVFLVSLAVSAVALYRPGAALRRIERQRPRLVQGMRGAVIAALVALVANDSGVVAAATMMIPVTATLMHLVLAHRVST